MSDVNQGWWIDTDLHGAQKNQVRYDAQRDWDLLWKKDFIFAGCNGGIASDIARLEAIIEAANKRLDQYRDKLEDQE